MNEHEPLARNLTLPGEMALRTFFALWTSGCGAYWLYPLQLDNAFSHPALYYEWRRRRGCATITSTYSSREHFSGRTQVLQYL
jgi:hypothetical protein